MSAQLIDGKAVANKVKQELLERIAALKAKGVTPGLTVVLVGADPASQIYVSMKQKMCEELGLAGRTIALPESASQAELLSLIDELNRDDKVHGILVQMPLPRHMSEQAVLAAVNPDKDVDGFHAVNAGRLMIGQPGFVACTPAGVMRLLKETGVSLSGLHAVVLGRSNIVGKPVAQLLLRENCTVTVCHSRTRDLPSITRQADVLVAAIGKKHFVTADMVKDGAIVMDVGINRTEGSRKIYGDVHPDAAAKASYITPVPGGVGPMTIVMLMQASVQAAEMRP